MVLQEDWIGKCSLACVVTVNDYALLIRLKLVVQLADKTDYRRRIHGSYDDLNSYFNDLDSSDSDSKETSHDSWGGSRGGFSNTCVF